MRSLLRIVSAICVTVCLVAGASVVAQVVVQGQAPRKRLLVIGEEKGYRHEAVTHAMVTIERLGKETGLWDTVIRTDTEALTKKKLEYNAKNLDDFDAVVFYTGGTLEMDASQQADFLSFVHDDGKGFVGIHSATITFTKWPAYGEMIGGYFDEHPWGTFDAPVIVEDPAFPGMKQWPSSVHDQRRDLSDQGLLEDDDARPDAARFVEAGPQQPARSSQGRRFRGHVGQDVRPGPRLLLHARPRRSQLGQTRDADDDRRSNQMGAQARRR